MVKMSDKQPQEERRSILTKFNVFHDHNKRQAPGHEEFFYDVETLAKTDLKTYFHAIIGESQDKPWRRQTLHRAKAVSERVRRSLDEHRNEAGWRLHLEHLIFERFEIEVVCSACRARLWRSELEAAATNPDLSLESLQKRRLARKSCQCDKHRRSAEKHDNGLNNLFEDRPEDGMVHEEAVMCAIQKNKEVPDRVWGLRITKRIERILNHQRPANSGSVGESIRTSPFKGDASRLLYPFLVLETKSEKCSDSFSDINTQTGLIIRNLLNLQHEFVLKLPDHLQTTTQPCRLPLVWVVASKGDYWRLSGAYVSKGRSGLEYHILDLWDGRLVYEDQALRLLLILDYIFDWARDIYRQYIIDGLLSLVQSPSHSLRSDTDVFSIKGCQQDPAKFEDFVPEGKKPNLSKLSNSSMLQFYDRPGLAIRDSSYMSHNVLGLQITGENLDDFLNSVSKSQEEVIHLARQLQQSVHFSNCWYVTAECLSSLEKLWTECDRESALFQNPQQLFLAFFAVKSFFGVGAISYTSKTKYDEWLQLHKLIFVAIAEDALDKIHQMLDLPTCPGFRKCPQFSTQAVIEVFEKVRHAPAQQCFAAAVQSYELSSSYTTAYSSNESLQNVGHKTITREPNLTRTQTGVSPCYEFLERVYRQLKTGMREPDENFLRLSVSERQHASSNSKCTFWPADELKIGEGELAVLVRRPESRGFLGVVNSIMYCIFLLPPSRHEPKTPQLGRELYHVSTHTLEMPAMVGQIFNVPCVEILCSRSLLKALEILHHVSGCYFEHVYPQSEPAWRDLFRGWQLKDHPTNLDLPPEEEQERCLGLLRDVGNEFHFGEILKQLTESYGRTLRSYSPHTRPKPSPKLMPQSPLQICVCLPSGHRRSSANSPLENPRTSTSPPVFGEENFRREDQKKAWRQHAERLTSSLIQADFHMVDSLQDEDESMMNAESETTFEEEDESMDDDDDDDDYDDDDDDEGESALDDDEEEEEDDETMDDIDGEPMYTPSRSTLFIEELGPERGMLGRRANAVIFRMPLPLPTSVFMARDSTNERTQTKAVISETKPSNTLSPLNPLSSASERVASSAPSRRILIHDILNPEEGSTT